MKQTAIDTGVGVVGATVGLMGIVDYIQAGVALLISCATLIYLCFKISGARLDNRQKKLELEETK